MSFPALAHDRDFRPYRPYMIEKTCNDNYLNCMARMLYAPGQNPGLAGYGSYWFPRATRYVRVSSDRHVAWCMSRYRTYDPQSDTFVGKGHRIFRCNSPYDGS
jgi:hypothetical protein